MEDEVKIKMYATCIDCKEPLELAQFYGKLLKWEVMSFDEDWACAYAPGTNQGQYPGLTFQRNSAYVPPVWPEEPEAQQTMEHLDFAVNDLEKSVEYAISCGATLAKNQYSQGWRVMFDPAGHPFCLCIMKDVFESPHFGLL